MLNTRPSPPRATVAWLQLFEGKFSFLAPGGGTTYQTVIVMLFAVFPRRPFPPSALSPGRHSFCNVTLP